MNIKEKASQLLKQYWGYDSFRGHQLEAIESLCSGQDVLFIAPTSLGKCFKADTGVRMYDGGIKCIQDIKIGDKVLGWDSSPRNVLSTTKGKSKLFGVESYSGTYYVNSDHILCLTHKSNIQKTELRAKDIIKITVGEYLESSNKFKDTHHGVRSVPTYANYCLKDFLRSWNLSPFHLGQALKFQNSETLEALKAIAVSSLLVRSEFVEGFLQSFSASKFQIGSEFGRTVLFHSSYLEAIQDILESLCFDFEISSVSSFNYNSVVIFGCPAMPYRGEVACTLPVSNNYLYPVITVIEDRKDSYYGFMTDEDHMFLLEDYTVVHNSVCYQVPSLMLEGTAIIVSPLLSLMEDQITALQNKDILAVTLNSSQGVKERRLAQQLLLDGVVKLLYVAPETLQNEEVLSLLRDNVKISFVAFDEAHCISAYGHDFRPAYNSMSSLVKSIFNVPILALTATADKVTESDVVKVLSLQKATVYRHDLDRPSIYYSSFIKTPDYYNRITNIIKSYDQKTTGIVYSFTRKGSEDIARHLVSKGVSAGAYHAGLPVKAKKETLESWLGDQTQVVCATIAFGMGIDKSNVRYVIHTDLPTSVEGYIQECGRASRDGLPSETYLFYSRQDVAKAKFVFDKSTTNFSVLAKKLGRINTMYNFAASKTCKRKALLAHFSQSYLPSNCGNCDHCKPFTMRY